MHSRRVFLERMGLAAGALLLPKHILAIEEEPIPYRPVRIRGQVAAAGRGMGGVTVSDGLSSVRTNSEGAFELISSDRRGFVHISLPTGHEIPTNSPGTAKFYRPIAADSNGDMTAEFDLRPLEISDERHAFLLMADPQIQSSEDVELLNKESVPDIRKTAGSLSPLPIFGVAAGDIVYDRPELFPDYERAVEAMGIPCFQVPGNHDVDIGAGTDAVSLSTFKRRFGPAYYSFNRGEIHYVVLDDVFWFGAYIGYVDQTQLDWLKNDLSFVEKGRTVVVFMHIPPYTSQHIRHGLKSPSNSIVITNRQHLYRILEPYRTYFVCGHMHESDYLPDGGADIHICGALCGAWWSGPVCEDGTPNGYSVYTANGSELSWQYKSTGKDIDHQMRLYPPGSSEEAPLKLTANIWSFYKGWKAVWYENGMRKGEMKRYLGRDPLAQKLYSGSLLPEKHTWVDTVYTDHLFYAEPSFEAREIEVEVTDTWGRVYREKLRL